MSTTLIRALTFAATGCRNLNLEVAPSPVETAAAHAALELVWPVAADQGDVDRLRLLAARGPLGPFLSEHAGGSRSPEVRAAFLGRADIPDSEVRQVLLRERNQAVLAALVRNPAASAQVRAAAVATGKAAPARALVETYAARRRAEEDCGPTFAAPETVVTALVRMVEQGDRLGPGSVEAVREASAGLSVGQLEQVLAAVGAAPLALCVAAGVAPEPDSLSEDSVEGLAVLAAPRLKARPLAPTVQQLLSRAAGTVVDLLLERSTLPELAVNVLVDAIGTGGVRGAALSRHRTALRSADPSGVAALAGRAARAATSAELAAVADDVVAALEHSPTGGVTELLTAAVAVLHNRACPGPVAAQLAAAAPAQTARTLKFTPHLWGCVELADLLVPALGSPFDLRRRLERMGGDLEPVVGDLVRVLTHAQRSRDDQVAKSAQNHLSILAIWESFPAQLVDALPLRAATREAAAAPISTRVADQVLAATDGDVVRLAALEAMAATFEGTVTEFFTAAHAALATA